MNGRPGLAALTALLVVASLLPAPVAGQSDGLENDAIVTLDVQVDPENPDPGDNVTFTTTVENVVEDARTYNLQRVELREAPDADDPVDDTDLGVNVPGGQSVDARVSEEFTQSGEHTRYVHIQLLSPSGEVINLVREVNVTVEQSHPSLSLSTESVSADGESTLSVTVANGLPEAVRGVTLRMQSDDVSLIDEREIVSGLESGEQANVSVAARDVSAGEQTVEVDMEYVTADGESRSTTQTLSTRVSENDADLRLTDLQIDRDGDELTISGSASNLADAEVSGVLVSVGDGEGIAPGQDQSEAFVGTVGASNESDFTVTAALDGADGAVEVPLEVTYTSDGRQVTAQRSVRYAPDDPADVELTGVRVEQQGQRLVVRGSASNLAEENASGVVVSVAEGEQVVPAQSQSEYFVGSVSGSDFSSFEVQAALTQTTNQTVTIPLEVRYAVDGREITQSASVDYTPRADPGPDPSQQSSLGPVVPVVGILVVVALAVIGWRRYR